MPADCVADAHALLWFIEGNAKLGASARAFMSDPDNQIVIPAIALAEACRVTEKRRTTIPSVTELLAAIDGDSRMSVDVIDRDLVQRSVALPAVSEMHDRVIVATAVRRLEQQPSTVLLSADVSIRNSGLVPTEW